MSKKMVFLRFLCAPHDSKRSGRPVGSMSPYLERERAVEHREGALPALPSVPATTSTCHVAMVAGSDNTAVRGAVLRIIRHIRLASYRAGPREFSKTVLPFASAGACDRGVEPIQLSGRARAECASSARAAMSLPRPGDDIGMDGGSQCPCPFDVGEICSADFESLRGEAWREQQPASSRSHVACPTIRTMRVASSPPMQMACCVPTCALLQIL